jgi:hypothetical protein
MLRIPGSHNSKCVIRNNNSVGPTTEVKIIQKWDGNRPAINWLLRDFRRYLIQEQIDNNVVKRKKSKTTSTKRLWIETSLDITIEDYRKYANNNKPIVYNEIRNLSKYHCYVYAESILKEHSILSLDE